MLVLSGAQKILKAFSPIVFCEVSDVLSSGFGHSSQEVKHLFSLYGYRGYSFQGNDSIVLDNLNYHPCDNLIFLTDRHFQDFPFLRTMCSC